MTQRQKRAVAIVCACGSVIASFGFWTAVVSRSVLYSDAGGQQVWGGTLGTVGPLVEEAAKAMTASVAQQLHLAASSPSEVAVPDEVVGKKFIIQPSTADSKKSELEQWELRRAYSLSIPKIDVRAPILLPSMRHWKKREWNLLEEQMQVGLSYGAVAYPHSVVPGGKGSFIIAGHSSPPSERAAASEYGRLFERVPELQLGDRVIVSFEGRRKVYEVQGSVIVPPTATEILRQQEEESILVIITCYPIGTTRDRIVITAKLVE